MATDNKNRKINDTEKKTEMTVFSNQSFFLRHTIESVLNIIRIW